MITAVEEKSVKHKVRVLVVDDHPIVRQGLTELIGLEPDMIACAAVANAPDALKSMQCCLPDAAIVDLSLMNGNNGLELIKDIKVRWPRLPVLVLSMHDEAIYAERCLRAGARGYIMKGEPGEVVMEALHRVLSGRIWLSEKMTSRLLNRLVEGETRKQRLAVENLSDRELEVFRMLGEGSGTRDISEKLHLSPKTVDTYREHIKAKLGLESAGEVLQFAIRWSRTGNPG
jgi:DNA-binding NarL/FixJ family response regulator